MRNLSFARIMYGTSEDHRRVEAQLAAALPLSSDLSFAPAYLQELFRRAWLTLSPKR